MVREIRTEINRKSETLTTAPVLQSQTIKTLAAGVGAKSINLEAVIFAHRTYTSPPLIPVSHKMISNGRW